MVIRYLLDLLLYIQIQCCVDVVTTIQKVLRPKQWHQHLVDNVVYEMGCLDTVCKLLKGEFGHLLFRLLGFFRGNHTKVDHAL